MITLELSDDLTDADKANMTLHLGSTSLALNDATRSMVQTAADPLTAEFRDMPTEHGGGEFSFGLTFSVAGDDRPHRGRFPRQSAELIEYTLTTWH